jgi:hypothetical protein
VEAKSSSRLSSNASVGHRKVLEKSGLRWNGGRGGWIGNVDEATGSSSLAEALDAFSIGLLARRDTGSEERAASAVGDNARSRAHRCCRDLRRCPKSL